MKGICFIEPLFEKVVSGAKTETRRIASTSKMRNIRKIILIVCLQKRGLRYRVFERTIYR